MVSVVCGCREVNDVSVVCAGKSMVCRSCVYRKPDGVHVHVCCACAGKSIIACTLSVESMVCGVCAGKPMVDSTFSRNQLQAYIDVKKGKMMSNWVKRLCVISGTRLLVYKGKLAA